MPTAEQQDLIDTIARTLQADPNVEAAWLSGSLGRGAGDEWSDVDVLVLARAGAIDAVTQAYTEDVSAIAETALVNPLFGGRVLNVVTADWRRFDLSFVEEEHLSRYDAGVLTLLFNKGALAPPTRAPQPYETPPGQVTALVKEFLRVLGLLPVGMGRQEYVNAFTGIGHLRRMTIELMIEENGIAPADRGGALHLNTLLSADQREDLEALPPLDAQPDSIIAAHAALAALFLPRARALAVSLDAEWPQAFEDATRRHLELMLGMEV